MAVGMGIGAPSVGKIQTRFGDMATGGIAGVATGVMSNIFGPLGLITPLVVSAMVKGTKGETLAVLAGFSIGQAIFGGGGGNAPAEDPGM